MARKSSSGRSSRRSVQAVGQVAKAAGKPVIAFSTDASVAQKGVYLLSFMPESDVDTILEFASARGKRSVAAMIPNTAYGSVVAGAFQEIAARRGIRVVALERYAPDKASIDASVKKIASLEGQADALLIPDNGDGMQAVGQALAANGISNSKIQMLGTGVWDDPRVLGVKAIQGGWYAAPDKAGYNNFASRYRARYGAEPLRIATLSYDAVFLINALYTKYGASGFSEGDDHQRRRHHRHRRPVPLPARRHQPARPRRAAGRQWRRQTHQPRAPAASRRELKLKRL